MIHRDLFFPTTIYIKELGTHALNQYLEKKILDSSQKYNGMIRTNINSWHSKDDMFNMPEYKQITELLFSMQNNIFELEGLEPSPVIGSMWANVNPKGGQNSAHIHPNSLWSGVYYVKTPPNCGRLQVNDPRAIAAMVRPHYIKPQQPYQWREVNYEPVEGRCIMFPSWLEHRVEENKSNDVRISISFNFLQKRFL